jgi:hypothetical protein
MMGNVPARVEPVHPPRWVYVHFPRGAMFGEPGNRTKQKRVLEETLEAAKTIQEAGGKIEMPYRWEAPAVKFRGREIIDGG